MKYEQQKAVEMTGYGKRGKPKAGFPRFPQPLEIANDAIPTFPQPRRGAEKWKTKPRFPTFPLVVLSFSERRPGDRFAPLQAHSSIRKCCFSWLAAPCRTRHFRHAVPNQV